MGTFLQLCSISGEILGTPSAELKKRLDDAGVRIYSPYKSM